MAYNLAKRIDLGLISCKDVELINKAMNESGIPTENRIVIAVSAKEKKTLSGIYIPDSAKDELPKKGVVVQIGSITEDNESYKKSISLGVIVNYGLYAGKELSLLEDPTPEHLKSRDLKYMILSISEVLYTEVNLKEY